ncbi:MAG: FAD binding domain-containing protein [Phycisphaerae bacterium]
MYLPDIQLHQPATLDQACEMMEGLGPDARLLAGGTDLLVDLKTGRLSAQHLISVGRIPSMRGAGARNGGLCIGALTTPTQLIADATVSRRFAPIRDAACQMASPHIRNLATVGGNIASAVPCADLPPILMAMNASLVIWSRDGERELPLDSFFVGVRRTKLKIGEILTQVHVPEHPPRFGAAYARFALRDGNAIAVAGVAASLLLDDSNTVRDARIVLGAVAPIPKLAQRAAALLNNQPADEDSFSSAAAAAAEEAEPISDVRGSADFRRELVNVLTRRALMTALEQARGR